MWFFLQGCLFETIPDAIGNLPVAKVGDKLFPADTLGTVVEGIFTHRVMVPFDFPQSGLTVEK